MPKVPMNNISEQNEGSNRASVNKPLVQYNFPSNAPKRKMGGTLGLLIGIFAILAALFSLPAMYMIDSIVSGPKCKDMGGIYKGGDVGCVDPATRQFIDMGTGARRDNGYYYKGSL
jgi:hypothetical protein